MPLSRADFPQRIAGSDLLRIAFFETIVSEIWLNPQSIVKRLALMQRRRIKRHHEICFIRAT